jgi:hypothetical protein
MYKTNGNNRSIGCMVYTYIQVSRESEYWTNYPNKFMSVAMTILILSEAIQYHAC